MIQNGYKNNDADYNNEYDTDSESENIPLMKLSNEQIEIFSEQNEKSMTSYRKKCQNWSIDQITNEINEISKEIEELKELKVNEIKNKKRLSKSTRRAKNNNNKKTTYCFCDGKYSLSAPMVQCDHCNVWYHQMCVRLTQKLCDEMEKYVCENCKNERLKELDKKKFFISQKSLKEKNRLRNLENSIKLIKNNKLHFYRNNINFLSAFKFDKFLFKFAKKAINLSKKDLLKKQNFYEEKISSFFKIKKRKKLKKSTSMERTLKKLKKGKINSFSDNEVNMLKKNHSNEKINKITEKLKKYAEKNVELKKKEKNDCYEIKHDKKLIEKIKKIMENYKISQKSLSKMSKLTGGSTTLSSWLNESYVFNISEKENQLKKWSKKFLKQKLLKYSEKYPKFKKGEKIDFLYQKKYIEGEICKVTKGQYLIRYKSKKREKKKWVASMAKKVFKLNSKKRNNNLNISKGPKVKRKVIKKN